MSTYYITSPKSSDIDLFVGEPVSIQFQCTSEFPVVWSLSGDLRNLGLVFDSENGILSSQGRNLTQTASRRKIIISVSNEEGSGSKNFYLTIHKRFARAVEDNIHWLSPVNTLKQLESDLHVLEWRNLGSTRAVIEESNIYILQHGKWTPIRPPVFQNVVYVDPLFFQSNIKLNDAQFITSFELSFFYYPNLQLSPNIHYLTELKYLTYSGSGDRSFRVRGFGKLSSDSIDEPTQLYVVDAGSFVSSSNIATITFENMVIKMKRSSGKLFNDKIKVHFINCKVINEDGMGLLAENIRHISADNSYIDFGKDSYFPAVETNVFRNCVITASNDILIGDGTCVGKFYNCQFTAGVKFKVVTNSPDSSCTLEFLDVDAREAGDPFIDGTTGVISPIVNRSMLRLGSNTIVGATVNIIPAD